MENQPSTSRACGDALPFSSTPVKRARRSLTCEQQHMLLKDLSGIYSNIDSESGEEGETDESDNEITIEDVVGDAQEEEEEEKEEEEEEKEEEMEEEKEEEERAAGAVVKRRKGKKVPQPVIAWRDGVDFQPSTPRFDTATSGITGDFPVNDDSREIDYWKAFFDDEVMTHICEQTNLYYEQSQVTDESNPSLSTSNMRQWQDVNIDELYVFFALKMLMAHSKKHVLEDYWRQNHCVFSPKFGKYMARDRFRQLLRYLHFHDNSEPIENDRLWKIRNVFMMLKGEFVQYFRPFQKLCIDESLMLFRGRVCFRQYIPSKRARFGIKFFIMCDNKTGYVLDMIVYTASDVDIPKDDPHGFSGAVVKNLIHSYLGFGHILYTDNYYTSPALAKFLVERNTGTCGTVRANRKNWPKFQGELSRGQVQLKQADKMLAIRWADKKDVRMLSTIHKGEMIDNGKLDHVTREVKKKPDAVFDYNINMRLVDKTDMQIGSIECIRRCLKWYKKTFLHLIDITVLNAYNLYKFKTGKKISLRVFSENICTQILETHGKVTPAIPGRNIVYGRHLAQPDRVHQRAYLSRHLLEHIPNTNAKTSPQRRCHVCWNTKKREKKRRDVRWWCKECAVPLCVPCWGVYHIQTTF